MISTGSKFALVVPTLNEAENISVLLERTVSVMPQTHMSWEIIVVDDESADDTVQKVLACAEVEPRIRLLIREGKHGLAGAICYGWKQTDAALIGVMDADLQHPPELLPRLVSAVRNGVDIAIASRYVESDTLHSDWSLLRRVISRISVLASIPFQRRQLRVKDPLSGFFVLRHECVDRIEFQPEGFKLLLEILARGHVQTVTEVPFKFATRTRGRSKANAMTVIHYVALLCRLGHALRQERRGQPSIARAPCKPGDP